MRYNMDGGGGACALSLYYDKVIKREKVSKKVEIFFEKGLTFSPAYGILTMSKG